MNFSRLLRILGILLVCAQAAHAQTVTPWVPVGPQRATVLALQRDPFTPQSLWAGTYFGGLYKSTTGGFTWTAVPAPFSNFTVFAIAFDPQVSGTLYAGTFQGGVYKSQNGGQTWAAANQGLTDTTVQALAIDPFDSSQLIAVTSSGVFKSTDGAASWASANTGLTNIRSRVVAYAPTSNGVIYLGTLGAGVYRSTPTEGRPGQRSTQGWKPPRLYR